MWSLRFRFAKPPTGVVDFARFGRRLRAKGSGRVTITDRRGCRMTAKLPFRRSLPPARCR